MDLDGNELDTVLITFLLQLLHDLKIHLRALVYYTGHLFGIDHIPQPALHELEDDALRVIHCQGKTLRIGHAVGVLEGNVHRHIV